MTLQVAVIGAGPAGFYATEALAGNPDVHVDLIDRLPTPYGLIRSGVAPDHQTTKKVVKKYEQTANRANVRYVGNIAVGGPVSLDELRALYDAVVIAFGAEGDRALDIPGADKQGLYGAFAFVGWYNGHPDFADLDPDLDIETAAVIGNGNVALDCARLLARNKAELSVTDMADGAVAAIGGSPLKHVYVLGRRGPAQAGFSIAEMREMEQLAAAVSLAQPAQIPDCLPADMDPKEARARRPVLEVLQGFRDNRADSAPKNVHFEFFRRPAAILGDERVTGLRVEKTRLVDNRAEGTGEMLDIPCQLVIACIGYRARRIPGLPLDGGVVQNIAGRVAPGLYCVGWAKRGPTGTIGGNRPDAQDVVALLLQETRATQTGDGDGKPGAAGLDALLLSRGAAHTGFDHWRRIDAAEISRARPGAPRRKFLSVSEMLAVSEGD